MREDKEVKTLQNGGKQESRSCTASRILRVASKVPWEVVLRDLVFFFFTRAVLRYSALAATERSGLLVDLWLKTELQYSKRDMTIAATSLAAALWDTYDRIDMIHLSSRQDARQMLLMCCCIDNVLSKWTPRTEVLKGTLFPSMFAHCRPTQDEMQSQQA